jgi:NADH-quinone oxidoreductase subunit H
MPEATVGPLWSAPLLLVVLAALGWAAAAMDAAGAALADGRRLDVRVLVAPLRAVARLLVKQRATTRLPDASSWRIGGGMVLVLAVIASAVIPLGPGLVVSDLSVGLVWWTAFMALLWVAVFLTGWGGNAAYALIAGYRFIAQALAYEMPLAITVITVGLIAESLQVGAVAAAQTGLWYVVWMPVGFVIYLVTAAALSFWGPFATPTGADLAGGVTSQLAGVDLLVFVAGRYVVLVSAAAFAVPTFLGGGAGPLLPDAAWTLLKTLAVLALLVAARWRLPQVRMERFEEFAWVVLIPATLVQLFVVCVIVLAVR